MWKVYERETRFFLLLYDTFVQQDRRVVVKNESRFRIFFLKFANNKFKRILSRNNFFVDIINVNSVNPSQRFQLKLHLSSMDLNSTCSDRLAVELDFHCAIEMESH
jgi:hypothetical protein